MSGDAGNHNSKYNRKFTINSAGDIIDQASNLQSTELGALVSTESHARVSTENLTAGTTVEVRVKLRNQSSFTTLTTITGSETKIVDLTTWDIIHYVVTNYDGTPGSLIVTAFVKNPPPTAANSTVNVVDSDGDELDVNPDGSINVNVASSSATSPAIYNVTVGIGDVGVELSQALSSGTKKILIKHRTNGNIEFGFTAGLSEFITIPKGSGWSEDGLNLSSTTVYFKTDKEGVVEILEWS